MTSAHSADSRIRRDPSPLYLQARRQLLTMISSGEFPTGGQLPSEEQLARRLGVSRPTVREALALLQIEGIVSRRHGAGNFVNHVPPQISARIDELISFPELIAAHGFEPEMTDLRISRIEGSASVTAALMLPPAAPVLLVQRLYLASGRPAVWMSDLLPAALVTDQTAWAAFTGDMLAFLRTTVAAPVAYAVARVSVEEVDRRIARRLRVKAGAGVLRIEQTAYTATNRPVVYSISHQRPGIITYQVIRKVR
jgi:GntR family transcriptional regulator